METAFVVLPEHQTVVKQIEEPPSYLALFPKAGGGLILVHNPDLSTGNGPTVAAPRI